MTNQRERERERKEQKEEPRVTQGPSVDRVGLHIRESAGCFEEGSRAVSCCI
jgi:hypothetical protein